MNTLFLGFGFLFFFFPVCTDFKYVQETTEKYFVHTELLFLV